ncbi:MAG: hypothetical protein Q4C42_11975 [Clostridia bacterium]|nr:hypothetical protein [Clostridia bacterium]
MLIYDEDVETFINNEHVKSYNIVTHPALVDTPDTEPVVTQENEELYAYMQDTTPSAAMRDSFVIGVSSSEKTLSFARYGFKLLEGSHITENDSDCALISEELAVRNNLSVGDSISVSTPYIDAHNPMIETGITDDDIKTATLKVKGIFKVPDNNWDISYEFYDARNMIICPVDAYRTVRIGYGSDNLKENSIQYVSAEVDDVDEFIDDISKILCIDEIVDSIDNYATEENSPASQVNFENEFAEKHNYVLQVSNSWSEIYAAPVRKTMTVMSVFMLLMVLACTLIVIISSVYFKSFEVKNINILYSMGLSKVKLFLLYVLENAFSLIISMAISIVLSISIVSPFINQSKSDLLFLNTEISAGSVENRLEVKESVNLDHSLSGNGKTAFIDIASEEVPVYYSLSYKDPVTGTEDYALNALMISSFVFLLDASISGIFLWLSGKRRQGGIIA